LLVFFTPLDEMSIHNQSEPGILTTKFQKKMGRKIVYLVHSFDTEPGVLPRLGSFLRETHEFQGGLLDAKNK
jgi:hypothetical protein